MVAVLPKFSSRNDDQRQNDLQRELIKREAEIGGQLFGPLPKNHWRQFFCMDAHTWVWHEEWIDEKGQRRAVTTRYEIGHDGIIKAQDGRGYQRLSPREARNLYRSIQLYWQKIGGEYQRILQMAG